MGLVLGRGPSQAIAPRKTQPERSPLIYNQTFGRSLDEPAALQPTQKIGHLGPLKEELPMSGFGESGAMPSNPPITRP
ncbi:MAG: hypothetical protein KME20_07085 [Kaiparowitsia implicata GSE-PSE-MK54-09C]|nr:hypothetical protein [Kaiparowitsia implicata GSE-PSE-MK54-09C]